MSLFSGLGLVPDSLLALKPGCPLGILLGARQMVVLWHFSRTQGRSSVATLILVQTRHSSPTGIHLVSIFPKAQLLPFLPLLSLHLLGNHPTDLQNLR